MSILNYLIESLNNRVTVYHGDNYGLDSINGNYKVMSLDGSNQQEGPGIYFTTNKTTVDMYGDKIVSTTVNPKMFMRSRDQIGKYISVQNIAKIIKYINNNDDEFWMVISDYAEISNPNDVTDRHIMEMANILSRDQVRNFLITLEEKTDTENFVTAFCKYSKYYGTFHDDYDDGEVHYAILRNDAEPQLVNTEKIIEHVNYFLENNNPIKELAWKFRKHEEEMEDWSDNKLCFRGKCQDVTKRFVDFLHTNGYPQAKRTGGYYLGYSDDYTPDMSEWDSEDIEDWENGNLDAKHWWVVIGNIIVDITADQFHPNNEDDYRVVITNTNDQSYQ